MSFGRGLTLITNRIDSFEHKLLFFRKRCGSYQNQKKKLITIVPYIEIQYELQVFKQYFDRTFDLNILMMYMLLLRNLLRDIRLNVS
jgi:hypothetical protein